MKVLIDYKFENLNTYINRCRTNYFLANKTKQKETEISKYEFNKIPKVNKYPIELIFTWHIKNQLSDLDGKLPKNIIDGLVRAEKIEDDNVKYIQKITHIYQKDKKDFVEVEIKTMEGNNDNDNAELKGNKK